MQPGPRAGVDDDDYFAFGRMLLAGGAHGTSRILSRASVAVMTSDQLMPAEISSGPCGATSTVTAGASHGRRPRDRGRPSVGSFGWDGLGTSYADPTEDMTGILMTQRVDVAGAARGLYRFRTAAYQAIDYLLTPGACSAHNREPERFPSE